MFRRKFLVAAVLVVIVSSAIFLVLTQRGDAQTEQRPPTQDLSAEKQTFERTEIPVVIMPMKVNGATIPVEIECEPVFITKPDTLDHFSCVLVNNTNKSIRASGVLYTLILESNGKPGRSSRIDVANGFIHPDVPNAAKLLKPGGKQFVSAPLPMSERDIVIQGLEFEPVYLEFSDGTSVGTNADSIRLIKERREGAAWFREMLRMEYLREGKSVAAILPRLQEDVTSDNQSSWTGTQRRGADSYRRFLLEHYQKVGSRGVSRILEEK